ncbi:hypothetical protein Q4555_10810 [Octadecabacter sp. 1_MG-2023]|uniref:hypothetical protein n=1 Tax=unclassified Octadecabacter TaxID=196158 RepID=UPI001C0925FF|nr:MULTISPECIES: hypothetical protein [unclassified Octadecabacter]MBU2992079.1 hypothetical protein [Octadecabacter sp. B2R22]MDO6735164.1 hypothetical protein [Octadecabacter sp. 1_MG-2023]
MSADDLRITEVMYNPGATGYEYIEITNTGTESVSTDDFFVGNADFLPEYFDGGFDDGIDIPAGATIVLVPSLPDFDAEVFEPPAPISQNDFEAVYGPIPAGAVYLSYIHFFGGSEDGALSGGSSYTIGGNDIYAQSVYIQSGAAEGQSVSVSLEDGSTSIGAPTPGSVGLLPIDVPTEGDDTLTGTESDDVIDGLGGRDTINGGAGDDTLTGGAGNDAIDGGQDDDEIDLGDGNDNAWGGDGNDVLFGGTGLDRLNGNSDDDSIFGGKGGDIIQGGKGEDYIDGGKQSDNISGGEQSDEIYGGNGNDTINGDEGADLIYGGSGNDNIDGGTYDDVLYGDHGQDRINGGAGDDYIDGGVSDDRLNGNSGNDEIYGGRGNDVMTGGSGNDELFGGNQGDRLNGGDGEDILNGGMGNDELTGGAGADVFIFEGTVNYDVITDFEVGIDQIDFTAYGPISDADAAAIASQTGSDVVLNLSGSGQVTLEGIALGDLSLSDFIYVPDDILVVG